MNLADLPNWSVCHQRSNVRGFTVVIDLPHSGHLYLKTPAESSVYNEMSVMAFAWQGNGATPHKQGRNEGSVEKCLCVSRCNRLRRPLARLSGLQCHNMCHSDHGIPVWCYYDPYGQFTCRRTILHRTFEPITPGVCEGGGGGYVTILGVNIVHRRYSNLGTIPLVAHFLNCDTSTLFRVSHL